MKRIQFKELVSIYFADDLSFNPDEVYVVMMGKSNVGKSSLVNALFNHKIAKVSATPGKTDCINYYYTNTNLVLIDVPGYGYAKRGKKQIHSWTLLMQSFFEVLPKKAHIFLLIDSRRALEGVVSEALEYLYTLKNPRNLVLTKSDKLKKNDKHKLESWLKNSDGLQIKDSFLCSVKIPETIDELVEYINECK